MTDFYALLKQSILDRGIRDADDRQEVYSQARRAVIKQLWDFRPPLAADEIDMRVGAYDTAVERIELELRQVFAKAGSGRPAGGNGAARPKAAPKRPPPEPVRTATYASNGRGQSTALAEWAREQPEYAPGVQRAVTAYAPPAETEAANDDYAEDDLAEYEEEAEYEEVAPARAAPQQQRRPRMDRWSATAARQTLPVKFELAEWFGWLGTGEQIKVRLLGIAVGALFVLLVGVGAFILGARSTNTDGAAATSGAVRTEVSDAATAARIPNDKVQVVASYALFDGRDPRVFATTPDNPVYFDDNEGFARITSSTTASGVKAIIGPGLAARLAGQNVRVVVTARASLEGGAAGMRFAYQSGLAISHWQTANLSGGYVALGMEWRVPTMRTSSNGGDALIIEPGIPGDGTGVDIKSIRIDVLAS